MTIIDKIRAKADTSHLAPYGKHPVVGTTLVIRGLEGGLRKATAVRPRQHEVGEVITFVGRGRITEAGIIPLDAEEAENDPTAPVIQNHVCKADGVVVLDDKRAQQMDKALRDQAAEYERAAEAVKGVDPFPGMSEVDALTNEAAAMRESIQAELSGLANADAVRAYAADHDVDLSGLGSRAKRRELEDAVLAVLAPSPVAVPDKDDDPPADADADADAPDPDDAL